MLSCCDISLTVQQCGIMYTLSALPTSAFVVKVSKGGYAIGCGFSLPLLLLTLHALIWSRAGWEAVLIGSEC